MPRTSHFSDLAAETNSWLFTCMHMQGIQLYLDILDNDDASDRIDDLIEAFEIDIEPSDLNASLPQSSIQTLSGRYEFASVRLSFELECLPGFIGRDCVEGSMIACATRPCLNGGTCVPLSNITSFCSCASGFEGELCQVDTDDCLNVNCNAGTCVDLVGTSFACECEAGSEGDFCEVPTTGGGGVVSTSTTPAPGVADDSMAAMVGAVAGVAVGSIVGTLLAVLCVLGIVILVRRRRRAKSKLDGVHAPIPTARDA